MSNLVAASGGSPRGPVMRDLLRNRGFLALAVSQFFGAVNDNILKQLLTFMVIAGGRLSPAVPAQQLPVDDLGRWMAGRWPQDGG